MTKSERIFKDTYYECMNHIEVWGEERNPDGRIVGFNRLAYKMNESCCKRTINAVQKEIDRMKKMLDRFAENGIGQEKDRIRRLALEMTQVTLENTVI